MIVRDQLEGCRRGNGDGQALDGPWQYSARGTTERDYCACALCRASRWLDGGRLRGRLSSDQVEAVRDLIRHLGGEPP